MNIFDEAKATIKTAICRHEVWLVPDMVLFHGMRDHKFTIRCKECGFEEKMDGWEIKQAMLNMFDTEDWRTLTWDI